MSNKGIFEIPLFAILAILCQIRENSLIWSSLIWSHHCNKLSNNFGKIGKMVEKEAMIRQIGYFSGLGLVMGGMIGSGRAKTLLFYTLVV